MDDRKDVLMNRMQRRVALSRLKKEVKKQRKIVLEIMKDAPPEKVDILAELRAVQKVYSDLS